MIRRNIPTLQKSWKSHKNLGNPTKSWKSYKIFGNPTKKDGTTVLWILDDIIIGLELEEKLSKILVSNIIYAPIQKKKQGGGF